MVDAFTIAFEPWQFYTGLITFIIIIVGATFAIARFVYTMKGNVKVLETMLDNYRKDLDRQGIEISKLVDKYTAIGWDVVMQRLKQGSDS